VLDWSVCEGSLYQRESPLIVDYMPKYRIRSWLERLPTEFGTLPCSWLNDIENTCSSVQFAKLFINSQSCLSFACSLFLLRFNQINSESLPMELGTTPVSLFPGISKIYSLETFVREGGIRPWKKLSPSSSCSRLGRELPIFGGKSPLRSLKVTLESIRLERFRMGCGKLP
jgi:hypothetical protein